MLPFKKNLNRQFKYFRSVNILANTTKVLEKVDHLKINAFIVSNKALLNTQSEFRIGLGTTTALLKGTELTEYLLNTILVKLLILLPIIFLFADFSTLEQVHFNNEFSEYLPVSTRVVQDNILGLLLFSMYTSNFSKILKAVVLTNMQMITL